MPTRVTNRLLIIVLVASLAVSAVTLTLVVVLMGRMQTLEARIPPPAPTPATGPSTHDPVALPGYMPGSANPARARPGLDNLPPNLPPGMVPTAPAPAKR